MCRIILRAGSGCDNATPLVVMPITVTAAYDSVGCDSLVGGLCVRAWLMCLRDASRSMRRCNIHSS